MKENFEARKSLEDFVDEIPMSKVSVPIDGVVPESVKRKVNQDLWNRLSKEDYPEERAD